MNQDDDPVQQYRNDVTQPRKRLEQYCIDALTGLKEIGYSGQLDLRHPNVGRDSNPTYYEFDNREVYLHTLYSHGMGTPGGSGTGRHSVKVEPNEIQFGDYSEGNLLSVAKLLYNTRKSLEQTATA